MLEQFETLASARHTVERINISDYQVHGCLGCPCIEIVSTAGVCCSGMHALKYGMLSVLSGNTNSAVCAASAPRDGHGDQRKQRQRVLCEHGTATDR